MNSTARKQSTIPTTALIISDIVEAFRSKDMIDAIPATRALTKSANATISRAPLTTGISHRD